MKSVALLGDYEPRIVQALNAFTKPGSTMIDVGANLGLISLSLLKANPDLIVHAYEPSANSWEFLKRTQSSGNYAKRWHIHEAACSNSSGEADFHLSSAELGAFDGLSASTRVPGRGVTRVKLVRLDDDWESWSRPQVSVVKIDVEGSEGRVCGGMHNLLTTCRPAILMEWNLVNLAAGKSDPLEIFAIAQKYEMEIIDPDTLVRVRSLPLIRLLLNRGIDTFLLLPRELLGDSVKS